MSAVPQVFISATSRDLGSFRKAVADVLLTLGAHPIIQEHFPPDHRSVVEMLRTKIGPCDAVICLVGRRYGYEPLNREENQPRRSYTQLEYEIAVELGKPVFVFVATDDCMLDAAADESEELRGSQLEHLKRIVASDHIRMMFHSLGHLTDQVRVMRFDPESLARGVTTRLAVLLFADLIDGEGVRERRGELAWVRDVVRPFHELLQDALARWGGTLRAETPREYEVNFETADAAVHAALALHEVVRRHDWQGPAPGLRAGIHVGQIVQFGGVDESRVLQASHAMDQCRQLTRLAVAGQTLLTRTGFDIAREHVRQAPASGDGAGGPLRWCTHGRYLVAGADEPLEVCEVGVEGQAALAAPQESAQVQRADSLEERRMRGWSPAPGQEIPRRPGWFVERKLGEGGFGEVWVARHDRTRELRVFKYCFDPDRLSSFKRELTLFRLLRSALGHRDDIARLLEVELEEAPFYLESEFIEGGNLRDWGRTEGHLASLSLEERLRLVAEIAGAVAAAHSVGIIHKDLKPSNVFLRQASDGRWHPMLADFGIGAVADRSQLEQRGITVAGFSRTILEPGSSRTGTRMYQPPEANLARPATVQADVYALGVLLYQMIIGDFDQPLGIGWERRLDAARAHGWTGGPHREGEAPSEPRPQTVPAPVSPGARSLRALDPSGELVLHLLRDDIGACVDGDPSARLATAAQLVERLQTLDQRAADGLARRRAERAALRMQRLRTALATAIVALIVVGGLGALAFTEWRLAQTLKEQADQARRAADHNAAEATENARKAQASATAARQWSQLALDTLNDVIFDIQRSVENLTGSSPIRRRLLTTALKHLEKKLSGEFVQHSTADRHTAAALMSMGDLFLQFGEAPPSSDVRGGARPGGELRGVAESARRFYTRSMGVFQALAQADPHDAQARRDLSISYERLGDVHLQLGATGQALRAYQEGLELRQALAQADPHDAQARRDLSISHNKLGDAHLQLGATDQALRAYQEGLELRQALAQADPANVQAQQDLSRSFSDMAQAHERTNNLVRARPWYEKMLGVDREISQRFPQNAAARRKVAMDCETLSQICARSQEWTVAVSYARQALDHARAARQIAGADQPFQWDFSMSLRILAEAQIGAGEFQQARQSIQEAIDATPQSAAGLNNLAWLLATHWEGSIRDGKKSIDLATKACELTKWKDPYSLDTLAAAYAEGGRFDEAVKWQKKALEHPDAFPGREIDNVKARLKLYEAGKPYHEPRPAPPGPVSPPRPPSR
jgi:serine/threonine protein kinase